MDSEADEVEEHKKSPSQSNEDGSGGDAREGSDSEVDSPFQIRRIERGRGSRKPVLRGVPVVGKGKGTMADVRRSLLGGQSMRLAGLVRWSMPAPVEPQHPIVASPGTAKNLLHMSIRVTGDAQLVARKRLVLPRHSSSPIRPAREPTLNAVRGRLVVAASTIPLLGKQGVWTGVVAPQCHPPPLQHLKGNTASRPTRVSRIDSAKRWPVSME